MDLEVYRQLKGKIHSVVGINLDPYKDEQMRRRLDSWLARSGAPNWDAYFERIKRDEVELRRFRDYLTINVTEFFRDPERWKYLRENILPELIQSALKRNRQVRIWSAGCSTGAEPYTLAMLLEELSPGKKAYILATDLDRGALEKARMGGPYVAEEVRNISPIQRSSFFKPGGPPFYVNSFLIEKVTFRELDLIFGEYERDFDLIVCRNVVIYFTTETKQLLYQRFSDSLRSGGVLFVGGTEIIPRPQEFSFRSTGFSFYVKS
ncbi:MAG: protein-glutamate O-methyltransferase CheR [Anaerolineae bacterium]|nr:protein-glutamate O-methyltransferase CheR [Anaerolineae bacterium]